MQSSEATTAARSRDVPYDLIGGAEMVRRIVDRFYDIMDTAPEANSLRAMHAPDLTPMRERLTEFLTGWLGGPPTYFQRADRKCIRSAHAPFAIGEAERDQWMLCMRLALADCGVSDQVREMIDAPLYRMCDSFRNK